MWFRNRRQRWKKQRKADQVDELVQANPQSPFPRVCQNLFDASSAVPTQSFSDVVNSLSAPLNHGREILKQSHPPAIEFAYSNPSLRSSVKQDKDTSKDKCMRLLRQE